MPEFILDMGDAAAARTFNDLDLFTRGYIMAMFWTETGNSDDEELKEASFAELAPSALTKIIEECKDWQESNVALLDLAYEQDGYSEERAGHDYWLTRNGHGAGFWDRDELEVRVPDSKHAMAKDPTSKLGDMLSDAARYSERSLYRGDDGLIYYQ